MPKTIIGSQFVKHVCPLIDQAKKTIDIIVFDWRWYSQDPSNPAQIFNQTILRAVRRGVVVRVITNIAEVLAILKQQGCHVKKPSTEKLIHPKVMIIDDKTIILGSHNYTQSAFTTNFEVSIEFDDELCVSELKTFFNNLFLHG